MHALQVEELPQFTSQVLHRASYLRHEDGDTVILKVVASYDRWIWHANFRVPGSNNGMNVLDKSPVFERLILGEISVMHYKINVNDYDRDHTMYGMIFIHPTPSLSKVTCCRLVKHTPKQSTYYKSVKRTFEVFQARLTIVREPAHA